MVQAQLKFYHTQPDRLPEPVPVPMPHACVPRQIFRMSNNGHLNPREKTQVWDVLEVREWQKHNPNIIIHDVGFGCGRNLTPNCNLEWDKARRPFVPGKPVGHVISTIESQLWLAKEKEGYPEAKVSVTRRVGVRESLLLMNERDRIDMNIPRNKERLERKMEKITGEEKESLGEQKKELKKTNMVQDTQNDEPIEANNDKSGYWGYFWAFQIDRKHAVLDNMQGGAMEEKNKIVKMVRPGQCILDGAARRESISV